MAIDILTISVMSDEPERVFSGAKITLQGRRTTLGIDMLRALECIKLWNKLKEFDSNALDEFIISEGSIRNNGKDPEAWDDNNGIVDPKE